MIAATVGGWMGKGVSFATEYTVKGFLSGIWAVFRSIILDPLRLAMASGVGWVGRSLSRLAEKMGDAPPISEKLRSQDLENTVQALTAQIIQLEKERGDFSTQIVESQKELAQAKFAEAELLKKLQTAQNDLAAKEQNLSTNEMDTLQQKIIHLESLLSLNDHEMELGIRNQVGMERRIILLLESQLGALKTEERLMRQVIEVEESLQRALQHRNVLQKEIARLRSQGGGENQLEPSEIHKKTEKMLGMLQEAMGTLPKDSPCLPSLKGLLAIWQHLLGDVYVCSAK